MKSEVAPVFRLPAGGFHAFNFSSCWALSSVIQKLHCSPASDATASVVVNFR
jgi:hypothetical protein